jgi:acyl-coenzyme A thioesterase PaaI-like protein
MKHTFFKLLLNLYPPYWGTGIIVRSVSPDYREIVVQMKLLWYNRNYVGTHFGGSLYAMADPFFMLMLMQILGKGFVVWDRTAQVDFIKPGKGKVTARFLITGEQIEAILQHTSNGQKYFPEFSVEVKDEAGETVVRVVKTLYVRRKGSPYINPQDGS